MHLNTPELDSQLVTLKNLSKKKESYIPFPHPFSRGRNTGPTRPGLSVIIIEISPTIGNRINH